MPDTITKHYNDWKKTINLYFGGGAIVSYTESPPPQYGTFLAWASTPYSPHRFFFESIEKPQSFHNDFPETNKDGHQLELGTVVRFSL